MYRRLTNEEKRKIRELTRKRVRQSEIARRLKIGRGTISKWQVRMGLLTRLPRGANGQLLTPAPEKKILRLLQSGLGLYPIARKLRIPMYRVRRVAQRNNFQRTFNSGKADPQADVAGFIEAIKNREDHIKNLADKFHVGLVKANKLAHEILQTHQFRPGASKPPLSSAFPQKHFGPRVGSGKK